MNPARGIIVDSSILVLLVVGGASPQLIRDYKKTCQYDADDFQVITTNIARFGRVFATPHIATETANLIGQLKGNNLRKARAILRNVMNTWVEIYEPPKAIAGSNHYLALGLADAAIIRCAEVKRCPVLTDDLGLHFALEKLGLPNYKYSHWRGARWFQE